MGVVMGIVMQYHVDIAFTVLPQGAREKLPLPPKLSASNGKLMLAIIDWLLSNKLGWEHSLSKQLGLTFVNSLGEALWYVYGKSKQYRSLPVPYLFQVSMVHVKCTLVYRGCTLAT